MPARFLVPAEAGLIALDWGTSALRAFRMGAHGEVLEMRHRPWGIMNLPPASASVADSEHGALFERALQDSCGDWLTAAPGLPLLACGMVGSAQGWREAKYLPTPTSLDALARGLMLVERRDGPPLPDLFTAMPWGSDRLLTETRARLAHVGVTWHELTPLTAVDTVEEARAERLLT